MPKLREIIAIENQALKDGNFHGRKFQSGNWQGLAYQIEREENDGVTRLPSIIDNYGEGTDVSISDTYPIQFYHRLVSPLEYPQLSVNDDDSFGDGKQNKEVAEMVLICMGDRSKVEAYPEEVCSAICADFVKELTPTQLSTLQLQECTIEIIDTQTDTRKVFDNEYQNVDFSVPLEMFLLSVRYRITTVYGASCFNLCN